MTEFDTQRARLSQMERVPVFGRMAVDAFDAWLGLVDAMNLGGLRTLLLNETADRSESLSPSAPAPVAIRSDRPSPRSTGSTPEDHQAARSLPLSHRAA